MILNWKALLIKAYTFYRSWTCEAKPAKEKEENNLSLEDKFIKMVLHNIPIKSSKSVDIFNAWEKQLEIFKADFKQLEAFDVRVKEMFVDLETHLYMPSDHYGDLSSKIEVMKVIEKRFQTNDFQNRMEKLGDE